MTHQDRLWPVWVLPALLLTAVSILSFDYSVLVPQPELRYRAHRAILDGTAPLPQRAHVLVPYAIDPVIRGLSSAMPEDAAFRRAYFGFHIVALTLVLASIYRYAREWFTRDQALVGTLIIATTMRIVLRQGEYWDFSPIPPTSVFAPWSLLEPVFVAAGLMLAHRRNWRWLAAVAVAAFLNSGAGLLLGLAAESPAARWQQNIDHLPSVMINLVLFLGAALVLAFAGFGRAPRFARRAAIALTVAAVAILATGYWWEVRAIVALYPALTPLVLSSLFAPRGRD